VDAAPGIAVDPADLEALAAEQRADRAAGRRLRPEPRVPLRDVRPHPHAVADRARRDRVHQQRHLDRVPAVPVCRGQGGRGRASVVGCRAGGGGRGGGRVEHAAGRDAGWTWAAGLWSIDHSEWAATLAPWSLPDARPRQGPLISGMRGPRRPRFLEGFRTPCHRDDP
jgi:hypothetical protein